MWLLLTPPLLLCLRFANIDKEVKEVLKKFKETKNAVECCNSEGLMKHLEKQQGELEICEKALVRKP